MEKPARNRQLENTGVDGRMILKCIFEKWDGDKECIELSQDWGRWRAVVNAVMNLWVRQNAGNFLASCGPVGF